MVGFTFVDTAYGAFGFVARDGRLLRTFLPDRITVTRKHLRQLFPSAVEKRGLLPRFRKEVRAYFEGKPMKFTAPVDLSGMSQFRQAVLNACQLVPYGETASYGDLARAAGSTGAARAVGGVMAINPLPLVIPCHRILRSDGSIGGFSSRKGISEKRRLLRLEGISGWEEAA